MAQNPAPRKDPGLARAEAFAPFYREHVSGWPVPVEERDIETRIGRTHLLVWGPAEAPPLVLLHGGGGAGAGWEFQAALLGTRRRVYAPDMPGQYGLSVPSRPLTEMADLLAWLDEVLGALRLSGVDLLGNSRGGAVAACYALHAPSRLRRLGLIAPSLTLRPLRLAAYLRSLPWMLGAIDAERFLRGLGPQDLAGHAPFEERLRRVTRWMTAGRRRFGLLGARHPRLLSDAELRSLSLPTLVVIGEHEVLYGAKEALARAALIPRVQTALIPGAGHDLLWSQPERIGAALTAFLDR
jgi:pimeloyl-ACP methyl ester carboxylesterase